MKGARLGDGGVTLAELPFPSARDGFDQRRNAGRIEVSVYRLSQTSSAGVPAANIFGGLSAIGLVGVYGLLHLGTLSQLLSRDVPVQPLPFCPRAASVQARAGRMSTATVTSCWPPPNMKPLTGLTSP